MIYWFFGMAAVYILLVFVRLLARPRPTTVAEFFSFGASSNKNSLRDAFFVTNASFATAFVTLFLYAGTLGYISIVTPLAFFAGSLFFAYFMLKKAFPLITSGRKYPQLLGESASSRLVRVIASSYVLVSLWLFTYVELQGFLAFARYGGGVAGNSAMPYLLMIPILLFMGVYTARSGFSGVISSDSTQKSIIVVGAISFLFLAIIAGYSAIQDENLRENVDKIFPPMNGSKNLPIVVEAFTGFLFAQILYYDNWQRIGAYSKLRRTEGARDELLYVEVKSAYIQGSWWLLLLYLVPVALGFAATISGSAITDASSLVSYLERIWSHSILNKILLCFCFLYLSAALISTIEVYVVSIVNNIVDDIGGLISNNDESETSNQSVLGIAQFLAIGISLSFLPALFFEPDFQVMFTYLFFSANGFVGPILFLCLGWKPKSWAILASLGFCATWPALSPMLPEGIQNFGMPGLLTVLVSVLVCAIGSRRDLKTNSLEPQSK